MKDAPENPYVGNAHVPDPPEIHKKPRQLTLDGLTRTPPRPAPRRAPRPTPEELRDDGIRRSIEHAGEDWQASAYEIIWLCANKYQEFFYDDYHRLAATMELPPPPDKRAWGAVMRAAKKAGWITKTGVYWKSAARVCHGADKPVYRSNIYAGRKL